MPRVGSTKSEQSHGSSKFKFEGGPGEIVSSSVVYEYPDNPEIKAACGFRIGIQQLNATTLAPTEMDVVEELLKWGAPEKFHVGQCEASDSVEYEEFDPADKPDAEGNCVISLTGAGPDTKSGMSKFSDSLEEFAFRAEFLNGFAPNLIGLKALFFQKPNKESTIKRKDGSDPTNLVVTKIFAYPYETEAAPKTGAKTGAAAGKATAASAKPAAKSAAPAPKVNGTPAPPVAPPVAPPSAPPAAASDPVNEPSDEAVGVALSILAAIGTKKAGKELTFKNIYGAWMPSEFSQQRVVPAMQQQVKVLMGNREWLNENVDPLGWVVNGDTYQIPAATA